MYRERSLVYQIYLVGQQGNAALLEVDLDELDLCKTCDGHIEVAGYWSCGWQSGSQ